MPLIRKARFLAKLARELLAETGFLPTLFVGALLVASLAGCPKHLDDEVCAVDAKLIVQEPSTIPPVPPTPDELQVRRAQCKATLDAVKPGFVECMARCYGEAATRGALFDCDRRCGVTLQK